MVRWVYIAGRGHSGSTLLDAMLGNSLHAESVGELVSGMGRFEAACSCGAPFVDCGYWQSVRRKFEDITGMPWKEATNASISQAHIRSLIRTILATQQTGWIRRLITVTEGIGEAVVTGKSVIVDSSKEITRALFLLRFMPEAKVIHLIRHPANILGSDYYRLQNGSGFKFLRHRFKGQRFPGVILFLSSSSWLIGNALFEFLRWFDRKSVLRVRYEDLIADPLNEINRIEGFLDVPLDEVKRKLANGETFQVGHNIGGNHMRMAGSFVFDQKKAKREGLPLRYKMMAYLVSWPMMWAYGYK